MHDIEQIVTARNGYILTLLRLLSNPRTPHTISEVWCRLDFPECLPILTSQLRSDDPSVAKLVLNVLQREAELHGYWKLPEVEPSIAECIRHDDQGIRQAAIAFFPQPGLTTKRPFLQFTM
jgi:hypothetical protein